MSDEEVLEADLGDQEMDLPVSALTGAEVDETFGLPVVNTTGVSNEEVFEALQRENGQIMAQLGVWAQSLQASQFGQGGASRSGGIMARDAYLTPDKIYDQIVTAQKAAEDDDVTGGYIEATESLAFSSVSMFAEDPDEQDIYNQVVGDLELDARLREIWREVVTYSQVYMAVWWRKKTYKVKRKPTKGGAQRRKTYTLDVPVAMELLDPLKVVPVQVGHYGGARLAYCASRGEAENITNVLENKKGATDKFVKAMIEGPYEASRDEQKALKEAGFPATNLFLFKEGVVFRHTLTKPNYARWANVRMKSIFELLDAKRQLRQMDRAYLLGGPLRVDQRMATPQGWKPIGEAQVGDEVFGPDGKPTKIIGVYPQGILPGMRRVTFSDGGEVICDLTHLWTVSNPWGKQRTITLEQIVDEGLYQPHGDGRLAKHRIPMSSPLQLPEVSLPVDPYLMGYMLGDGSFSQSIPKITCAEPEDDQPWREVLPEGTTVSQYETREGFCNQYGLKGVRGKLENDLTAALRETGVWNTSGASKFIPDDYLWASEDQRWSLLQGLLDSDGSFVAPGIVEFSNISEKLADDFRHLVQSLGGVARKTTREAHGNCQPLYRVCASLPDDRVPFRLKRKAAKWSGRRFPITRTIVSVDPVEDAEALCIKVDREDGLFLTEDMIVTHNTNFLVVVTKGTDALPASPAEVDNLRTQVRTVHRLPVLVGDHRLKVEIVTPKMDNTLKAERYNTIDSRITARLYQIFALGGYSAGASGDDSVKLVKVIARGMESRRHMIRRTLEKYIFDEMYRRNERTLKTRPRLQFHPQSIALDFDSSLASFLLDLRASREISRETLLSQFDLNQSHEALMLQREEEEFDDIFQTLAPPGSPGSAVNPRRDNGGGDRNGGGAAPGTGQGQPARNPRRRSDRGRDLPEIESNLQVVGADGEVVELTAEQIELIEKVVENA